MIINWYEMKQGSKDRVKDLQAEKARERLIRQAKLAQHEHDRLARPDFNLLRFLRNLASKPAISRPTKPVLN